VLLMRQLKEWYWQCHGNIVAASPPAAAQLLPHSMCPHTQLAAPTPSPAYGPHTLLVAPPSLPSRAGPAPGAAHAGGRPVDRRRAAALPWLWPLHVCLLLAGALPAAVGRRRAAQPLAAHLGPLGRAGQAAAVWCGSCPACPPARPAARCLPAAACIVIRDAHGIAPARTRFL
jgi:hypothetical protein